MKATEKERRIPRIHIYYGRASNKIPVFSLLSFFQFPICKSCILLERRSKWKIQLKRNIIKSSLNQWKKSQTRGGKKGKPRPQR